MINETQEPWESALQTHMERGNWRSLAELLNLPEFQEEIASEFPPNEQVLPSSITTRRSFLKLLNASIALVAAASACEEPGQESILPYVSQQPDVRPGVPNFYATSMTVGGFATGLVVKSHVGRPVKIEGNPLHSASLGATGIFEQASLLQLYDPHRARSIHTNGVPATWRALYELMSGACTNAQGAGVHFLLEPTSSPLMAALIARLRERCPQVRFHFYAPLAMNPVWAAATMLFGRPLIPHYDFGKATTVLALDADFLAQGPFHLRYAHQFANRRRIANAADGLNRLYAAEAMYTVTGAAADHRLRVRRTEIMAVTAAVLAEIIADPSGELEAVTALPRLRDLLRQRDVGHTHAQWLQVVTRDLRAQAGKSIVIAGEGQPAEVHVLAYLINVALGNVGNTVWFSESAIVEAGAPSHGLDELLAAIDAGRVRTLAILEGNPAYTAPANVAFVRRVQRVSNRIYLGLFENETSQACNWFVPALQYLEAWGDARAYDGTVSFVQPLIRPLYGGRTPAEIIAAFLGEPEPNGQELLRAHWRKNAGTTDFNTWWEQALHAGLLPDTSFPVVPVRPDWTAAVDMLDRLPAQSPTLPASLEIAFYQDSRVYDGSFTNNAWLLELPDPILKLSWDNAAIVSPATAVRLGLQTESVIELHYQNRTLRAPVYVLPGHADDSVSVHLGWGRAGREVLAVGVGFDAYRLRTSIAPYFDQGLAIRRLDERYPLALTQTHFAFHGRPIIIQKTLEEYRRSAGHNEHDLDRQHVASLYHVYPTSPQQWGMVIDLATCTGCSSCVVACQAENNVPVVGKLGVRLSREMHRLRIDRYYSGGVEAPRMAIQPMLCQHCERAPCEYVCPVNATVHSADGLNEMVYNRCVGTRFCSNNCPYKVRRFNYFDYNRNKPETLKMAMNPDLTVRARGVMEKCTFCVQRIRQSQIQAQLQGRPIRGDEIQTACQQACPTNAIVFGAISDPHSTVSRLMASDRAYAVLNDLGTLPRVRYLTKITNPNPDIPDIPDISDISDIREA